MARDDSYRNQPFPEAITYLQQKINVDTDRSYDVTDAEHDAAFVVAGAKGAMLNELREAVTRAIAEGQRVEEFQARFNEITEGWSHFGNKAWRAKIIYDTNLRMAHAAGRYQQIFSPENLRIYPYLQYLHGGSSDPRPHHLALHEQVFEAGKLPWFPPSGYQCSCRVISLKARDLSRFDLAVSTIARGDVLPLTVNGKTVNFTMQPEKGFDFIPGQTNAEVRENLAQNLLKRLAPDIRQQAVQEMDAADQRAAQQKQQRAPAPDQKYQAIARKLFANELEAVDKALNPPQSEADRRLRQTKDRLDRLVQQARQTKDPKDIARVRRLQKQLVEDQKRIQRERTNEARKAMSTLRKAIVDRSSVSEADAPFLAMFAEVNNSVTKVAPTSDVRNVLSEALRFTNGKSLDSLKTILSDEKEPRPYALPNGILNIGATPNLRGTMFHELGHHVEFESRQRQEDALAWVRSRSTSDRPVPIRSVIPDYSEDFPYYPGPWVHPYVGRVYPPTADGSVHTEVISVGLQHFTSVRTMLLLYAKDPDHFLFTLGIIKS